jgi:hypothetical protein
MNRRNVVSSLWQGVLVLTCLLGVSVRQANATRVEIAEDLLVDLRSEDLTAGTMTEWPNRGSLGGVFTAFGAPVAETDDDWGANVVRFDGTSYFDGPVSPAGITGSGTRTIEVWVYNVGESKEECMVAWSHRGGPNGTNMTFNYGWKDFGAAGHWGDDADMAWEGFDNAEGGTGGYPPLENWTYLTYTYDGAIICLYVNGELNNERAAALNTHAGNIIRIGGQNNNDGSAALGEKAFTGAIAQIRVHDGVLTAEQVQKNALIPIQAFGTASNPQPQNGDQDVPLGDLVLSWEPGMYPGTHTVYFSEDMNAVADGTAEVASGLTAASYDPGLLDYETMYYWRVDEVNDSPDGTVYQGKVWDFTVEPVGYPMSGGPIVPTASSTERDTDPNSTVNGAGLNENDEHSIFLEDMWSSASTETVHWIQFAFPQVEKLDKVHVWNHNTASEAILGFGIKEARIEYSVDGETWSELGTVVLAQAPGKATYTGEEVALDGIIAQYVKVTGLSNYSILGLPQRGLSEVRFYAEPMRARLEIPADGTGDVHPLVNLTWRSGREAVQHEVRVGTAPDALTVMDTVDEPSYTVSLDLDSTVYWQVNEINDASDPAVWEGVLWSLHTAEFLTVDDMESYRSNEGNYVWETWTDGFGDAANGAMLGHDGDDMETGTVYDGRQSLPYYYGLDGAGYSEASRDINENWGEHNIASLSLMFYGEATNAPGQMVIKANDQEIAAYPNPSDLTRPEWQNWTVELPATALGKIDTLAIGIKGGTGMVLIDAIRLYPSVD